MSGSMAPDVWAEWQRVLRDVRPSAVLVTVERRKPALHAAWLARAFDDTAMRVYAGQWHEAGWSPAEWWQLAVCELALTDGPFVRELTVSLEPDRLTQWRELAAEHGPLTATLALRGSADVDLEARLFWARAERKVTHLGVGRPGDAR